MSWSRCCVVLATVGVVACGPSPDDAVVERDAGDAVVVSDASDASDASRVAEVRGADAGEDAAEVWARTPNEEPATRIGGFECPEGMVLGNPGINSDDGANHPRGDDAMYCVERQSCDGVDCGDDGACEVLEGKASCVCAKGYAGDACEDCDFGYERDGEGGCAMGAACDGSLCSGHGSCAVSAAGALECECEQGVAGERCDVCAVGWHNTPAGCVEDAACEPGACGDHGTCDDSAGHVACRCEAGWFGAACDVDCASLDCNGRGRCVGDAEGVICACDEGYDPASDSGGCAAGFTQAPATGDCIRDLQCGENSCSGRGACSGGTAGPIACACEPGWGGPSCGVAECSAAYCGGRGSCSVVQNRPVCACAPGSGGPRCGEEVAPTRVQVRGASRSVSGPVRLDVSAGGIGNFDADLVFTVPEGQGRIEAIAGEEAAFMYHPPEGFASFDQIALKIGNAGAAAQFDVPLVLVDETEVPMTGWSHPELARVDRYVTQHMNNRCIGAMSVVITYKGRTIHARGYGRSAGRNRAFNPGWCGTDEQNPYHDDAHDMTPSTPVHIGSVTKGMTAAMLRLVVEDRIRERAPGRIPQNATYDQIQRTIENTSLLDSTLELLPERLRQLLAGEIPLLAPGAVGDGTCHDPTVADPRWHEVTLGHLLSHRSGLAREGKSPDEYMPFVHEIRYPGFGPGVWDQLRQDQEAEVLAQGLSLTDMASGRSAAATAHGLKAPEIRFVSPYAPDGEGWNDSFFMMAHDCLNTDPGDDYEYSNAGMGLLGTIVTHVHGRFSNITGQPSTSEGSRLQQFLSEELGVEGGMQSDYGIYYGNAPHYAFAVQRRSWAGTFEPTAKDLKRPWCHLPDGAEICDFSIWSADGDPPNWSFAPERVPIGNASIAYTAAAGGFAAEPLIFARFMNRFYGGGYGAYAGVGEDVNPEIGERIFDEDLTTSHNGALSGGRTFANWFGDRDVTFTRPATDTFYDLVRGVRAPSPGSFEFGEKGLRIFVYANQRSDKACVEATAEDDTGDEDKDPDWCSEHYTDRLMAVVPYALSRGKPDWKKIREDMLKPLAIAP